MKLSRRYLSVFCAFSVFCVHAFGVSAIPATTADGYTVPQPNPSFTFPRDHGSHPDYKIEWWYLTGHFFSGGAPTDPAARRFGFQATFFRVATQPASAASPADPVAFGHEQIHLAHMALLDAASGRFYYQERLNREGWNASASPATLAVRNGDWTLALTDPAATPGTEILALTGGIRADARFAFTLTPTKPLVRFGEGGYSRKGAAPTAASYYLTFSRLALTGTLTLEGTTLPVTGEAWMDHEYSSSQLDKNQVGWDWLSAQLKDGRELMFYRMRTDDGGTDPASTLTWIDRAGKPTRAAFRWEPLTFWTSPHTGAKYPQRIRLTTTDPESGAEAVFLVEPLHPDQELVGNLGGVTYWEGACRLLAPDGTEKGNAYMELTGYDRPVEALR